MIPARLKLNNFMSYGIYQKALNFKQLDLTCLVGNNGVGKSSVLEAIAWAIWGKSRAKSDDELVRQGEKEMWVDFEFELLNDIYRILRKKSVGKGGQSGLEFYKKSVEKNEAKWIAISGSTKSETQEAINDNLKMTYDTFINSAYLRQGRADEFTIKKPTERKKVLSDILNLSYYEKISQKANKKSRELMVEQESLQKKMDYFEQELENKEKIDESSNRIKLELDKLDADVKCEEEKLQKLKDKKSLYEKRIDELRFLEQQIKNTINDLENINKDITIQHENNEKSKELIQEEDNIIRNFNKLKKFLEQDHNYEQLLKEKNLIEYNKNETQKNIINEKSKYLRQLGTYESQLKSLEKEINFENKLNINFDLFTKKLFQLEKIEGIVIDFENKLKTMDQRREKISREIALVESHGKELKDKIEKLESVSGSDCPLCKQELSDSHRHNVIYELTELKKNRGKQYLSLKGELRKIEQATKAIYNKINESKEALRDKADILSKVNRLKEKLERVEQAKIEKVGIANKLENLQTKINTGTYDKGRHHKLEEIERKMQRLNYDDKKHKNIKKQILELNKYQKKKNKLDQIKINIKQAEKFLEQLIKNKIKKEKELLKLKKKRDKIKIDYDKIEKIENDIADVNQKLNKTRSDLNNKQGEYGAAAESIKRIKKIKHDYNQSKRQFKETKTQRGIFEELFIAFGKNGVQSMIIESAVPEIEDSANQLLGKMSDGKMNIQLKTKKEKKTDGNLIDTLDILIEDENGIRNYEMFSGGEAYRINFSIRIALSKLLANRTGAKLQFLVVDEGFGTQDFAGREYLIQAINSISDDFKKIIVITHIQDLKDMFPSRIEITKDLNGSNFKVIA